MRIKYSYKRTPKSRMRKTTLDELTELIILEAIIDNPDKPLEAVNQVMLRIRNIGIRSARMPGKLLDGEAHARVYKLRKSLHGRIEGLVPSIPIDR